MRVEKETGNLQTPAQTMGDRMYVPLRDIVESLGLQVFWEDPGLIVIGPDPETLLTDQEVFHAVKEMFP